MESTFKVVLDTKIMEQISYALKNIRLEYHLFFEMVYRTGYQGRPILRLSVDQIPQFLEDNAAFIPDKLRDTINTQMQGKKPSDYFFSATRNPSQSLSRRTIETVLRKVGQEHGIENLTVKTISRTFLFEQFRIYHYNYKEFKVFLRERGRFINTLDQFLAYCGLTEWEYKEDIATHSYPNSTLCNYCVSIVSTFSGYMAEIANPDLSRERYLQLADLIVDVVKRTNSLK